MIDAAYDIPGVLLAVAWQPVFTFEPRLDLFPLLAAVLAAASCAVLGNFLVLRRISLMGDAISHSVLPGLVIAFLLSASRSPAVMFAGAAVAGLATVALVELVKRLGRVEPGAAMGVVFSILFALGVLLIERAAVRHVDLDADCVLYGQLETLVWYAAPDGIAGLFSFETLAAAPREVVTLTVVTAVAFAFVGVLFKELRIAAFDGALATSLGFSSSLLHAALMVVVAAATVASFEAVGSILVIAMLICPAATARVLTDRLRIQILLSIVVAVATAVVGYAAASAVPAAFGLDAVNAAGAMTVAAGGALVIAIVAGPKHGVIAKARTRGRLARRVAVDDLLATLYRAHEAAPDGQKLPAVAIDLGEARGIRNASVAIRDAMRRGLVARDARGLSLTPEGFSHASLVISKHRRWESYLVDRAGLAPDHVHDTAEQLEHVAPVPDASGSIDPHGRQIPRIN
ncbi:MAG: metal ABC transporter permease [Planctomycetota bacterium]